MPVEALLLPIQREGVGVLVDDDLREQSVAAHRRGQREGHLVRCGHDRAAAWSGMARVGDLLAHELDAVQALGDELRDLSLRAQHHLLHLLQVLLVLIELVFEGHRGINALLQVLLGLVDLLLRRLELLVVVRVD